MLNYPGVCKFGTASVRQIPFHICKKLTLIYIITGRLEISTVAGSQTLWKGQIEILNVKEPIMLHAEDTACKILYFCFDDALLANTAMNFEWVTYNCNICNFFDATAQKEHIDMLTTRLLRFAIQASSGITHTEARKKTEDLLKYIVDWFDDVGHVFSEHAGEDISKERFQRISAYMIANVTKKISLQDIARSEYLSMPYLSKEFAAKLEKNYHTIINYYRTIHVVIQLLDTDDSLTYIAETSGFSSVRYYHKVFSSFLGCLPSKFRALYKGKPQEVTDETLDVETLEKMIGYTAAQTAQTNIKIVLPPDCQAGSQKINHFTYSGSHEGARAYTFTLQGAPHTEKGVVLYIDDDTNRRVQKMTSDLHLSQSPNLQKLQGPRREVWHLTESETKVHAVVSGTWTIALYIIL